ncbi:PH domain-containing protein [Xylanibacillus composti]|uniref:PH domain-containing protein n=1 Tax=Xylanibacillus composti TaxID=1572762 RepID=UPI001BCE13E4|nr:PH domain-containing protein [Xylanibacillus composti]
MIIDGYAGSRRSFGIRGAATELKFQTKRDPFFVYLFLGLVVFINIALFAPLFFEFAWNALIVLLLLDLFRSKISYKDITKITRQPSIWMGYRLIFSRDAIEVHYKTGFMGSVVISPKHQEEFITELLKRNPNIRVEGKDGE